MGKENIGIWLDQYADFEFDLFRKAISESYEAIACELTSKDLYTSIKKIEFEKHCEENGIVINSEEGALHYEYFDDLVEVEVETYMLRRKLEAISEMKVIYLYKNLEINIVSMLRISYSITDYKWEDGEILSIKDKFSIKSLKKYNEINSLRMVNNIIKHNTDPYSELEKKFNEFSRTGHLLSYKGFEMFYQKMLPCCNTFLHSLKDKILVDLG